MKPEHIKRIYNNTAILTGTILLVVIVGGYFLLKFVLLPRMGYRLPNEASSVMGGLMGSAMVASLSIARWRVRRLGLSRESVDRETVTRSGDSSIATAGKPVELRNLESQIQKLAIGVFIGILCAFAFWLALIMSTTWTRIVAGIIVLVGLPLALWTLRLFCLPDARVDEKGVFGSPAGEHSWMPRRVGWEQIVSCDIITVRDVAGEIYTVYPVLKDAAGKVLLTLHPETFANIMPSERRRFHDFIRARLAGSRVEEGAA